MKLTLKIAFDEREYFDFMRSISGDGGGQRFVRYCQQLLREQNDAPAHGARYVWWLTLHGIDVERWFTYRDDYGPGGFQARLGRQPQQESKMF